MNNIQLASRLENLVEFAQNGAPNEETHYIRNGLIGTGLAGAGYLGGSYLRGRSILGPKGLKKAGTLDIFRSGHFANMKDVARAGKQVTKWGNQASDYITDQYAAAKKAGSRYYKKAGKAINRGRQAAADYIAP